MLHNPARDWDAPSPPRLSCIALRSARNKVPDWDNAANATATGASPPGARHPVERCVKLQDSHSV